MELWGSKLFWKSAAPCPLWLGEARITPQSCGSWRRPGESQEAAGGFNHDKTGAVGAASQVAALFLLVNSFQGLPGPLRILIGRCSERTVARA
jgi:hypothetical protein